MTRRMSTSGTDHVPVLHNCGPTSASVYRTGCVGTQAIIEPRALVCALLALAGVPELPAVMFRPVQECQLHPALVAAAAGVTLDLAAKALNATSMVDDRELLARIVGGRRALGPSRAAYPALAMERLEQMRECTARICGGTRLNGVVRWSDMHTAAVELSSSAAVDLRTAATIALHGMTLLAYASPPIFSLRRAPSLAFFRIKGGLEVRNFGHPVDA